VKILQNTKPKPFRFSQVTRDQVTWLFENQGPDISVVPEVCRTYPHPVEVSNKKIGRRLHTSLHNFATKSISLKIKR
jgi:hypothetical protein